MKIYFIRHGETDWNKDGKIQGQADVELNEHGRRQAEKAAVKMEKLNIQVAFTSPLKRAVSTAQIMLKERPDIPIVEEKSVIEIAYGVREGQLLAEIHGNSSSELYKYFHNPAAFIPPVGGESLTQVKTRACYFLEKIVKPLTAQGVAVFSHGAFIRGIISVVEELPDEAFWIGNEQKNCSITEIEYQNGIFRLLKDANFL